VAGIDWIDYRERIDIQRCSVCGKPTLRSYSWHDYSDPTDDFGARTLYPTDYTVADLPPGVAKRYADMLQMLDAPDAFAVRRQAAGGRMSGYGVAQKVLHQSLEHLGERERLPDALAAPGTRGAHRIRPTYPATRPLAADSATPTACAPATSESASRCISASALSAAA
jgi:hypothetical protein